MTENEQDRLNYDLNGWPVRGFNSFELPLSCEE